MVILFRIITLLIVSCLPLFAAESGELLVRADRMSHDAQVDVLRAAGSVEIDWSGSRLYADMAEYYRDKGVVAAKGSVKLVKGKDTLAGEAAEFEIDSKNGVVHNGTIFMEEQNLHVSGSTIEKKGEKSYRIENGTITSCDGEKPSWKFKVDELNVDLDEFAYGKNAFFYLTDTPVFWLPYLVYPAKTERQSGFLLPTAGNSTKKGAFLEIPYYWAISPSQDLTITADLESKRGFGVQLEHRYLGRDKGFGSAKGYLIYDTADTKFRGELELKQQANLSANSYWRADVNLTLDRKFYNDYKTNSGDYNRQYLSSTAFLSQSRGDMLLTGGGNYLENLYVPNDTTLQMLPFLTFNGTGRTLPGTPLYYTFATALTNFDRDSGDRGQRLQFVPRLQLPVAGSDLLYGSVWGGYNQRFYTAHVSGDEKTSSQAGLFEAGGTLRMDFAKVYATSFGDIERVRHSVTPELSYAVTETRNQNDLPLFDYNDRPVGGQLLTFSLLNAITGRTGKDGQSQYRDLLRFNVSQGYQLSGGRRDLLVLVDYDRPFTDTRLMLELFPAQNWRILSDNRISPYNGNLTNATVSAEVGDPKGTRAAVNYQHAQKILDYIEGKVTYADFKPFTLSAAGRYSFNRPGFLETYYSVEYKHQCWGVIFSYRDRIDNKEFSFSVNLSGLGSFKLL